MLLCSCGFWYIWIQGLQVNIAHKICLADFFWTYILVLNWNPQDGKPSWERETALSALAFTPVLLDKKQTDDQNQNIFQKILLKSMPFWPQLQGDECHFLSLNALLCSDELNCPLDHSGVAIVEQLMQWIRDSEAVTVSLFFLLLRPRHQPYYPYPWTFCTLPSLAHIKKPRWWPLNPMIIIYDLTEKQGLWTV